MSMHSLFAGFNSKGMIIIMDMLLFMLVVASYDQTIHVAGPERVQEFHACVGTSAYIPWPLNVISKTGHKSTVVNLIFQRRHSEKKVLVASLSGHRDFKAENHFRDRLSISSENSGIFLDRVTMDDTGTYFAQAHISNGQVWTRTTNLTVHLRPIVYNGRLNVSQSEAIYYSSKQSHCINITCGTLEYAGYPPAKFVWTTQSKTLSTKVATDDSATSIQICSPFLGDITCSIAGFSSVCTYDHVATVHLDLPGPRANSTIVLKSTATQDLVLTIVMPILAVLVPLAVLGVWVLSHIVRSSPLYRGQDQSQQQGPQAAVEIEENATPEHTQTNGDDSEDENGQTEVKDDVGDTDDDNSSFRILEGNNMVYHRDSAGSTFGHTENRRAKNENAVEGGYRRRANEEQPLMDDIIGTVV